jgi:hypothetical protein
VAILKNVRFELRDPDFTKFRIIAIFRKNFNEFWGLYHVTNMGASSPKAGGHNPVFIQQWYLMFSSKQGKTPRNDGLLV